MRRALVLLALVSCGGEEPCTVVQDGPAAEIRCPDGTSHRLEPALTCSVDGAYLRCGDGTALPLGPGALPGCRIEEGAAVVDVICDDGSVRSVAATETGGISGLVQLAGTPDASGVRVEIAGRSVLTGADGRYRLQLVPVGRHELAFQRDGFSRVVVPGVPVLPGTYELDPVLLE